jgi:hypothetical protein
MVRSKSPQNLSVLNVQMHNEKNEISSTSRDRNISKTNVSVNNKTILLSDIHSEFQTKNIDLTRMSGATATQIEIMETSAAMLEEETTKALMSATQRDDSLRTRRFAGFKAMGMVWTIVLIALMYIMLFVFDVEHIYVQGPLCLIVVVLFVMLHGKYFDFEDIFMKYYIKNWRFIIPCSACLIVFVCNIIDNLQYFFNFDFNFNFYFSGKYSALSNTSVDSNDIPTMIEFINGIMYLLCVLFLLLRDSMRLEYPLWIIFLSCLIIIGFTCYNLYGSEFIWTFEELYVSKWIVFLRKVCYFQILLFAMLIIYALYIDKKRRHEKFLLIVENIEKVQLFFIVAKNIYDINSNDDGSMYFRLPGNQTNMGGNNITSINSKTNDGYNMNALSQSKNRHERGMSSKRNVLNSKRSRLGTGTISYAPPQASSQRQMANIVQLTVMSDQGIDSPHEDDDDDEEEEYM